MNTLYYGDNLDILRRYMPDASVDLIYLDPPFNSNRDYNILFKEQSGEPAQSQIKAFTDTWKWSERAYVEFCQTCPRDQVVKLIQGFVEILGRNDVTAYLVTMAPRLVELHRVLKPTGSIYLHCDPTASHYLKLVMDAVFGAANFRNEIVWRRAHPKGHAFTRFASTHDVILSYSKTLSGTKWNPTYLPHDPERAAVQYSLIDETGRHYQLTSLLNPNPDRPNLTYEFKGVTKVWRWTKERMLAEDAKGRIIVPRDGQGIPRYKRYLDEQEGIPLGDWWGDIEIAAGAERLGYPTQKPLALLERIIQASSNEGDSVLDPFCGCGTAIIAAHKLRRQWLGIDVTSTAVTLIKSRLADSFDLKENTDYAVVGEPRSEADARALALKDRDEFQKWAVGLVPRAYPFQEKKGADTGIDGVLRFQDDATNPKRCVIQVKSGHVSHTLARDFRGVIEREKATLGLFITLEPPTKPMQTEADALGYYTTPLGNISIPRFQIRTVAQLLKGEGFLIPGSALLIGVKQAEAVQLDPGQGKLGL